MLLRTHATSLLRSQQTERIPAHEAIMNHDEVLEDLALVAKLMCYSYLLQHPCPEECGHGGFSAPR
jgi:hypothetical protein